MKRCVAVVVLLLASLVAVPGTAAWACSCVQRTAADAARASDVVVRGVVTHRDDPGRLAEVAGSGRGVTYEVEVAEVFRGRAARRTFVVSAADGASCGLEVTVGREYVLMLRARGDQLTASLCDGTVPATAAVVDEVVAAVGPGAPPTTAHDPAPGGQRPAVLPGSRHPSDRPWQVPLVAGSALALVLVAALVLVPRTRRGVLSALSGQGRRGGDSAVSMERGSGSAL